MPMFYQCKREQGAKAKLVKGARTPNWMLLLLPWCLTRSHGDITLEPLSNIIWIEEIDSEFLTNICMKWQCKVILSCHVMSHLTRPHLTINSSNGQLWTLSNLIISFFCSHTQCFILHSGLVPTSGVHISYQLKLIIKWLRMASHILDILFIMLWFHTEVSFSLFAGDRRVRIMSISVYAFYSMFYPPCSYYTLISTLLCLIIFT